MKSKITLSIQKKTIAKAKELAKKRNSTVSQMVEEYFERTSKINEKLRAKESISGIIDADLAAEEVINIQKRLLRNMDGNDFIGYQCMPGFFRQ